MARVKQLKVNGITHEIDADAQASLLTVLREQLDLTGSKYGCGEGQCGACTVLINGNPRKSCITPVGAVGEKKVITIEGLARSDYMHLPRMPMDRIAALEGLGKRGRLHPLQQAFLDEDAMQCAYCTSGMIMTAVSLLSTNPNPSDAEILQFMEGNICRCGTYPRIVAAIRKAAKVMRESGR
jgi:aerobic-type carbon monoxide dehydrogenase small subunit (CoxS/CutS family)